MPINENMVQEIVQEVMAKMQIADAPTGKHGIFKEMNDAIEAAKKSQLIVKKMSMDQREKIITCIRKKIKENAEVMARMGVEETGMGNVGDKILKHHLPDTVRQAREAGAEIVIVHGETLCDQVETGTNFAAIEAGADILAHPGLIDEKCAEFAAERGVALEFTSCPRHALANAHVADLALRFGCLLVRGSAARCASELATRSFWMQVVRGADVFGNSEGKSNLLKLIENSESVLVRRLSRF